MAPLKRCAVGAEDGEKFFAHDGRRLQHAAAARLPLRTDQRRPARMSLDQGPGGERPREWALVVGGPRAARRRDFRGADGGRRRPSAAVDGANDGLVHGLIDLIVELRTKPVKRGISTRPTGCGNACRSWASYSKIGRRDTVVVQRMTGFVAD